MKITATAAWLGVLLSQHDEFPAAVFRLGAELGLTEGDIRRAFAEIGAHAVPTGHTGHALWTLDAPTKQAFLDWAASAGVPPYTMDARAAYAAFWSSRIAAAPLSAPHENRVPTKTAVELEEERRAASWRAHYDRQLAHADRVRAEAREREQVAAQAQREAAKPTVDSAGIYANRRRAMGHGG